MLSKVQVMPTLPATDIERAEKFYHDTLGLETVSIEHGELLMKAENGTCIAIYKRDHPTRADHTVLTFEVNQIENEIKELENLGVKFEDYDLPFLKTENHIATIEKERGAWFKDSEGNILCIHENIK